LRNNTRLWTLTQGTVSDDHSRGIAFDQSTGIVFVGGDTHGKFPNEIVNKPSDWFLMTSSTNGTFLWLKQFETSTTDIMTSVALHVPTGRVLLIGTYGGNGDIIAVNQNGTFEFNGQRPSMLKGYSMGNSFRNGITFAEREIWFVNLSFSLPTGSSTYETFSSTLTGRTDSTRFSEEFITTSSELRANPTQTSASVTNGPEINDSIGQSTTNSTYIVLVSIIMLGLLLVSMVTGAVYFIRSRLRIEKTPLKEASTTYVGGTTYQTKLGNQNNQTFLGTIITSMTTMIRSDYGKLSHLSPWLPWRRIVLARIFDDETWY